MADFTVKLNKKSQSIKLKKIQKNIKLQHIGRRGAKGEDGDAGLSATIEIGTVTTVNPTDPATVTNVGTESEAVLDFEIPKGDKGDAGSGGGGGAVDSVNSQTGVVVLDADDIDDTSTTHKFVTSADLTKLSNLSGTNTGDQDLSGLVPKTTTVNGNALSSDVTLDIDDVAPTQTGNNGKVLKTDGTNATWQDDADSGGAWGDITGTLSDQTDLQSALDDKQDEITGLTASGTELNILDGATLSTTELNYVDGVTSAIQTQLNAKQPLDADLTALAAAGNSSILSATTASFLTADETKLDNIEALADVTANAEVDGGTYV